MRALRIYCNVRAPHEAASAQVPVRAYKGGCDRPAVANMSTIVASLAYIALAAFVVAGAAPALTDRAQPAWVGPVWSSLMLAITGPLFEHPNSSAVVVTLACGVAVAAAATCALTATALVPKQHARTVARVTIVLIAMVAGASGGAAIEAGSVLGGMAALPALVVSGIYALKTGL